MVLLLAADAKRARANAEIAAKYDAEALAQAHVHALTGACLAMGLRFAGTGDARAQVVLQSHAVSFLRAKSTAPDPATGAALATDAFDVA